MVPTALPGLVSDSSAVSVLSPASPRSPVSLANPKSRILACPLWVINIFAGRRRRSGAPMP